MCLGFFFFKQKTAYEMRISDWSSDVCSSDLLADPGLDAAAPAGEVEAPVRLRGHDAAGAVGDAGAVQHVRHQAAEAFKPMILRPEIGRASCRERVCQYV